MWGSGAPAGPTVTDSAATVLAAAGFDPAATLPEWDAELRRPKEGRALLLRLIAGVLPPDSRRDVVGDSSTFLLPPARQASSSAGRLVDVQLLLCGTPSILARSCK